MLCDCHAIWIERDVLGNSGDSRVRHLVGPHGVDTVVSQWLQIEVVGVALERAIARMLLIEPKNSVDILAGDVLDRWIVRLA